jgi:hypothetical protein
MCNDKKKDYENEILNQSISRTEKEINDIAECELITEKQDNLIVEMLNRRKTNDKFNENIDNQIKEIQELLPLSQENLDKIELLKNKKCVRQQVSSADILKHKKY